MKALRLITTSLLLFTAIIFTVAYSKKQRDNKLATPRSHRVIYADWKVAKDGTRTLDNVRVRDVSATGAWKEWVASLITDKVTKRDIVDPTKLESFNPVEGAWGYRSAAQFRDHKQFVREETIADYHCFTLRMERSQSQDGWIEISFTPELGATPLKLISHSSKGESVVEALKVY